MIKTFCDCCGEEIPNHARLNSTVFKHKRVGIDTDRSNLCGGYIEDFFVELIVTANIYKPVDLKDEVSTSNFVGHNICKNCIIQTLVQDDKK
jgi:hypothetical protein